MAKKRSSGSHRVRIIGGAWRGRRIRFADHADLRPTADRTRETLFNWLQTDITGARCLDLFAGSGALGFEAASRGAARVVLVDSAREVVEHLHATRAMLGADGVDIIAARARQYLAGAAEPFDVVFLDPPFRQPGLAADACAMLASGWLAPDARVYVEHPLRETPLVPGGWVAERETHSGDARGILYRVDGGGDSADLAKAGQ